VPDRSNQELIAMFNDVAYGNARGIDYIDSVVSSVTAEGTTYMTGYIKEGAQVPLAGVTVRDVVGFYTEKKEPIRMSIGQIDKSITTTSTTYNMAEQAVENYSNFVIQRFSVQYDERYNVIQTFTLPFITFYGNTVPILSLSIAYRGGDTRKEWAMFKQLYDLYLRPQICAKNNMLVKLIFGDWIYEGFITNISKVDEGQNPNMSMGQLGFVLYREVFTGSFEGVGRINPITPRVSPTVPQAITGSTEDLGGPVA